MWRTGVRGSEGEIRETSEEAVAVAQVTGHGDVDR